MLSFFSLSYRPRISPIRACHAINTHHTNLINSFQLEPHEQCLTFWVGQKTFLVFFTQGTNTQFIVSFVCLQVWKATVRVFSRQERCKPLFKQGSLF